MMTIFDCADELRIGKVLEVNANAVRVELDCDIADLTRTYRGEVYSIGQIGSIIKIHFGKKILFGYVRMLRMKSEIVNPDNDHKIQASDDSRILEADLFCQGIWSKSKEVLTVTKGLDTYPLPMQNVYLTDSIELSELYKGGQRASESDLDPNIEIGTYIGGNSIKCFANIDKMFGHHCAILGSTGSGKSGTVASLVHSVLSYKKQDGNAIMPRIIIIDPHGEYEKAFTGQAIVYKTSKQNGDANLHKMLKLPYWLFSGDELRSLIIGKTEQEATSQNNIIFKALKYSRMLSAGIVSQYPDEPKGDAPIIFDEGYSIANELEFDRDRPYPFDLDEFKKHIDKVQGRKIDKIDSLSQSERKSHDSILDKLNILRTDPRLKFMMNNYSTENDTVTEVMNQFFGDIVENDESKYLRIIDISGVPNEVAGVLTAAVGRLLFQYKLWETKEEREQNPVLLICEEAHRYVPNAGEAQYKEAQSSIRRIAKEGRKYGIGLMLVSQRPSEVESTVLSQCNTWIVLRLTNANDKNYVSSMLPDNVGGLTQLLSSLTRSEAIFVGEAAVFPSRIKIRQLNENQLPNSGDISFIKGWSDVPINETSIETVMNRWLGLDNAGTDTDEAQE